MVRWWRNQAHTWGRVPSFGDPRVDLCAGQLTTFTGLSALCHLDLELLRLDQIKAGYAKTGGSHLFDRAILRIVMLIAPRITIGIFTTFARIALATNSIHRNRQRL